MKDEYDIADDSFICRETHVWNDPTYRQFAEVFVPKPCPIVEVKPDGEHTLLITKFPGRKVCAKVERVGEMERVPANWTEHETR
jgi:hypothetical protein